MAVNRMQVTSSENESLGASTLAAMVIMLEPSPASVSEAGDILRLPNFYGDDDNHVPHQFSRVTPHSSQPRFALDWRSKERA